MTLGILSISAVALVSKTQRLDRAERLAHLVLSNWRLLRFARKTCRELLRRAHKAKGRSADAF